MFLFKRCKTDVVTERQFEQMSATIEQQQATIEYLAIMADIELPNEDNTEEEDEEDE